jgi:hypothetical protein
VRRRICRGRGRPSFHGADEVASGIGVVPQGQSSNLRRGDIASCNRTFAPANGLEMLKAIYNSLRPGGIAIIQTPNMSAISAGFSRFIEITHVTGFTESSLHEALLLSGFAQAAIFGSRTPLRFTPKRLMWISLQSCLRTLWRVALVSELGTDAPRILTKNLYAVASRDGAVNSTTSSSESLHP